MSGNTGLIVIGCGLPRTGTLSTKTALDMILPGKCYHIVIAFHHQEEWREILTGKASDEEFRNLFINNNYVAAVDGPFCFVYERAMKLFPNSKVLLTVRDPEKWAESIKETIMKDALMPFPSDVFNYLQIFSDYLGLFPVLQSAMFYEKHNLELRTHVASGNGAAFHNKWVADVEKAVSPEKLLKFNVAEGWEPLCKFLDVPIPDVPFPRINSRQAFVDRLGKRKRRSWLLLYEFISIPLLAGLLCYYTR